MKLKKHLEWDKKLDAVLGKRDKRNGGHYCKREGGGGEHCCTGIIPKDPELLTCLPIHETCCALIARLQKSVTMLVHADFY